MLLLNLFRFILGYVSLRAEGGFPERFVNLCAAQRVNLWDLRSRAGVVEAKADRVSYKRIRPAARKSGMRVRITARHGLPFFFAQHRRRVGVVVGAAFFFAAIFVLSSRVWSINVIGNDRVPTETILEAFEQLGVKSGVRGKGIDVSEVEFQALQKLESLSWLNMNISGSAVLIEVREAIETPAIDSDDIPADIVAARDGQLVTLRTFDGTAALKTGSGVLKGDLLISGIEESRHGTVSFCRAKGYAVARTRRALSARADFAPAPGVRVQTRKRFSIGFLMFDIPLGRLAAPGGAVSYSEKSSAKIGNTVLPISVTRHTCYKEAPSAENLSKSRAVLLAKSRFFEEYSTQFRYLTVEKQEITVSAGADGVYIDGKFTCLENIGKTRNMDIDDSGGAKSAGS